MVTKCFLLTHRIKFPDNQTTTEPHSLEKQFQF